MPGLGRGRSQILDEQIGRTLGPGSVSVEDIVNELDAGTSSSLRLSNNLGVTSLILLNCWDEEVGCRG